MSKAPVLYQEVRLSPTPSSPTSVLHIDATGSSRSQLLRAGSKRPFDAISGLDEETYTRRYLATEGSVFFRSKARSPRSFLWRILDDRKILEIQSVDLVHDRRHERSDSWLTFRIALPAPILRDGVVFADREETDAMDCFILTESKELFTVTLKQGLLTSQTVPTEFDASTVVKKYTSTSLSIRQPYRIIATSSLELLVSLSDGGLLRLERKANESGAQWRETQFSAGSWTGTLRVRGLFSSRQMVRYGEIELDPTAIAAMAKSPDGKFIWTVSLDHWLRAWSVKSGKVVFKQDLLHETSERDVDQRRQQYTIGAEQRALLQVVTTPASADGREMARLDEDGIYYLAVHSPRDHQFKFYAITESFSSVEGDGILAEDQSPDAKLIPPIDELLNTNVWHLEEFAVKAGPSWKGSQLWLRARTGALCKSFMVAFDLLDDEQMVSQRWQTGWGVVDAGPQSPDELKNALSYPGDLSASGDTAIAPSERWIDFLFYPGRFSTASMETALQTYRKGRGLPTASSGKLKADEPPLEERLTAAVTSKVILRKLPNEQPDYDRYQQEVQSQWAMYYSLLSHLHGRRQESVGFAFDLEDGLPWAVCADAVAPVRSCSGVELRTLNAHLLPDGAARDIDPEVYCKIYPQVLHNADTGGESATESQMVAAASEFRKSFSAAAHFKLAAVAERDALVDLDDAPSGRVLSAYEECGFEAEVSDEAFEALTGAVEGLGGLGSIKDDDLLLPWDWIQAEGDLSGFDSRAEMNRYGVKLLVQVAQETLHKAHAILLDMLTLAVFMAGGLEAEELDPAFNADQAYDAILARLRRVQLLLWLAGNIMEDSQLQKRPENQKQESGRITILQDIFIGDWRALKPRDDHSMNMPEYLTLWSKKWALGPETEGAEQWAEGTSHVLAHLVKYGERDLAVDFLRFTTKQPFATYVKGRLYVMTGDYAEASIHFQAAAEAMAAKTKIASMANSHLLSPEERNHFHHGLSAYYQHVTHIFEKLKVYSYVADFAKLALQDLENGMPDFSRSMAELDRKRGQADSPALEKSDNALREIQLLQWKEARDEVLNRMFNAYVQTGRFAEAHEALEKIHNPPMQRSNIKKLLESCIKQDAVSTLLELPIEGDLALETDKALLEMAKRDLDKGSVSTSRSMPYYQILYAFRTQHADFRGAAEILYEQLERLRNDKTYMRDPEDETVANAYVLLINTLACCGEQDAWLLADPIKGVHGDGHKRKLVTLADVRRDYTAELDRRSDMLHGRFPLVAGGDEMDMF